MADGGKPTVTKPKADRMSKQNLDNHNAAQQKLETQSSLAIPSSSRPTLTSQHSNSLPSTPFVKPRELPDDYQTPSPIIKSKEITSPRSARSESDSTLRSQGRPPFFAGCKYETGMAHGRRRFPYSLGDEPLPQEKQVKKNLDPSVEEKLSGDTRELYDQILPSADSDLRRTKLVQKLEKILNERWPGNDIKVHVFGSSGNLLCSNDSDVDICITTPMKALERTCLLAKTLAEHGMERIVCVPQAKVPIVKIWDPDLQLACDMNVNNTLALENTRMIKTYVQIDPRVRQLAMVVKHWTRRRVLNDAALGATLSSYTWICLIINFLQTRKPKILPTLQGRPHQCLKDENGKLSPFADDLESLRGYGNANKETIGQLLFHFFRKYGHEMDYDKNVVSIREGCLIPKKSKPWQLAQNKMLGVEEPFNTERNLGNTVDDISFRGVHEELRRAFDLISQGDLAEACKQYEFPMEEKKFWVRPAPQPRPVLSRSLSQDRRKVPPSASNPHGRMGGNNKSNRSGPSNRRASTTQTMNGKMPPFPVQPNSASSIDAFSGAQLHDQLMHHYQMLQAQETQLRLQMHQRQQANVHAQITVTGGISPSMQQLHMPATAHPQQQSFNLGRRQSNVEPGPLSAPLRAVQGLYYPGMSSPVQGSRSPQPSTPSQSTTNPPSPSLSVAQPHMEQRRGMQRSLTSDNVNAAARSHSQPPSNSGNARSTPRSGRFPQALPYHTTMNGQMMPYLQHYQQVFMQNRRPSELQPLQQLQAAQMAAAENPRLRPMMLDGTEDGLNARQYVGYYVDPSLQPRMERDGLIPPIPAYHDLANRARTASPSSNFNRLRSQTSRSPSPSQHQMPYDMSSLPSTVRPQRSSNNLLAYGSFPPSQQIRPAENTPSTRVGPLIANGSDDAPEYNSPPESIYFPVHQNFNPSEVTSVSDEVTCNTPSSASVATTQDYPESFTLEPAPGSRSTNVNTSLLQFGELPARTTLSNGRPSQPIESTHVPEERTPTGPSTASRASSRDLPNGLGIDFVAHNSEVTDTQTGRIAQSQEPCNGDRNGETFATTSGPSPIPPPLLSPVREVRTPSPTTTRNNSLVGSDLPRVGHGRTRSAVAREVISSPLTQTSQIEHSQSKPTEEGISSTKATTTNGVDAHKKTLSGPFQKSGEAQQVPDSTTNASLPQTSGWQQTVSKKNKKGRKASSVGSATLMQEQMQRKGG